MWQAAEETRGPERKELLSKAGGQLFKARQLDEDEQLVHLAYGQLNIIRGDLKLAKVSALEQVASARCSMIVWI